MLFPNQKIIFAKRIRLARLSLPTAGPAVYKHARVRTCDATSRDAPRSPHTPLALRGTSPR